MYHDALASENTGNFKMLNAKTKRLQAIAKTKLKSARKVMKKEQGWNNYTQPISKFNERVHPCMRVKFENI